MAPTEVPTIRGLPGICTREELAKHIIAQGSFSPEENLAIFEKWCANAPRYLFRALDRKYGIAQQVPFSSLVYVGRKIEDWEYYRKSRWRVASNARGFIFKGQDLPDRAPVAAEKVPPQKP